METVGSKEEKGQHDRSDTPQDSRKEEEGQHDRSDTPKDSRKEEEGSRNGGGEGSIGHVDQPQPSIIRQQESRDDCLKIRGKERITEDIPQPSTSDTWRRNEEDTLVSDPQRKKDDEESSEQKMDDDEFNNDDPQPSTSGIKPIEMKNLEGANASDSLRNILDNKEDDQDMDNAVGEDDHLNGANDEDMEAEEHGHLQDNNGDDDIVDDIVDDVEDDDNDDDSNMEENAEQAWNYESIESCECKGQCPECPIVPNLNKKLKSEDSKKNQCPCGKKCCKEAIRKMYEDSIKRLMKCIQLRNLLGEEFQKFYKIFENMPMTAREFLTQYPVDNKNEIFSIHLLTQQIEIHFRSKTLVSLAASLGVQDAVEFFIEKCNADVNFTGIFRRGALTGTNLLPTEPPLFHAVHQGKLDVVKYLVQSGADVNYSSHGQSILFIACCRSVSVEIVKFLLESKARICCTPLGGIKCLQEILTTIVITEPNGPEIFELIVDNMENVDERDETGKTSLYTAVKTQHIEAIKILIEKGADINETFKQSIYVENEACENGKSLARKRKYSNTSDSEDTVKEEDSKGVSTCSFAKKESDPDKCATPMEQVVSGEEPACSSAHENSLSDNTGIESSEHHSHQDMDIFSAQEAKNEGQQDVPTSKRHIGAFEPKELHPIVYSAYKGNKYIVNYLASLSQIPRSEVANAYEVLGAERALRESASANSGIKYWLKGAEIRKSGENGPIIKENLSKPYETLNYFAERNTEEEIESLRGNHEELIAQAVMILERVIDYKDQETLRALASLAGGHLESGRVMEFIRITLDIHERYMLNSIDIMSWSCKELLNHWIMLFNCQELDSVTFESMMAVCKSVEKHLKLYLEDHAYRDPILFDYIDWGESTDLMLYLLMFMESICIHPNVTREDYEGLMTFIENLLRANYRDGQRKTFLHVAVLNKAFSIEGEDYYLLNNDQMAWLLIDLGADVNAVDKDGNRPLHLVYSQLATMTDGKELEHFGQFADMLVHYGAHVDVLNNKGESCVDLSKLTNFPLDVVAHTSLKCLAARTVINHGIPYKGEVPKDVEEWIQFHRKPAT